MKYYIDGKPVTKKEFEAYSLENCICNEYDGKGVSTCGFPCPVHAKAKKTSGWRTRGENKMNTNREICQQINDLHDSYQSPDARQAVEYIWDIYVEEYSVVRVVETIKHIADNIELLVNKVSLKNEGNMNNNKELAKQINDLLDKLPRGSAVNEIMKLMGKQYRQGKRETIEAIERDVIGEDENLEGVTVISGGQRAWGNIIIGVDRCNWLRKEQRALLATLKKRGNK